MKTLERTVKSVKQIRRIITDSHNFTLRPELRGAGLENGKPVASYVTPLGLMVEPYDPEKDYPKDDMIMTRFTITNRIYISPRLAEKCGINRLVDVKILPEGGFLLSPVVTSEA